MCYTQLRMREIILKKLEDLGQYFVFVGEIFLSLFQRPFRINRFFAEIETLCIKSIPIIVLSGSAIGMIFALQMIVILQPFQGEIGIGAGLNIDPVKWLTLSTEVVKFSDIDSPDLRLGLRLYPFFDPDSNKPWHWLYIDGGMAHILDGSPDFYIGGGLRFNDNEVRSFVGLVPYAIQ